MSVYTQYGYNNRTQYLMSISEEYGVDLGTVYAVASMLGENEDFDGLLTSLEDYAGF